MEAIHPGPEKLLRDADLLRTVAFDYVEQEPLTPATYGFRSFLSRDVAKHDRREVTLLQRELLEDLAGPGSTN